jgi:Periplasmic copper-binding protein (NosD)
MSEVFSRRAFRALIAVLTVCLGGLHPMSTLGIENRPAAQASELDVAPRPCDMVIPAATTTVDGDDETVDVGPGTVICLAPGERGNLKLFNLHGSPEDPVIVRNADDGPTTIVGDDFEAGILLASVTNVRITGTGAGTACGAEFTADAQECGIRLEGTRKGIRVLTERGAVEGLEIDHLAISRLTGTETRAIAIHPVEGQTVAGISIHHNYVSGAGAEAIYIGSEPRSTVWAELGKVDRVDIADNLVEDIGWDAIKLKVALSDSRIHGNVIQRVGLATYEKHQSGITVTMSVVDVHDNRVSRAPEGIKSGRAVAGSTNRFHGNVVSDVVHFGIQTVDDGAQIYGNTIVRSDGYGIRARGDASRIFDNIVADARRPISSPEDAIVRNNLVGAVDDIGFVNPEGGDFRPDTASPARSAGRISRLELCARAGMRAGRPVRFSATASGSASAGTGRCRSDLGALSSRVGSPP